MRQKDYPESILVAYTMFKFINNSCIKSMGIKGTLPTLYKFTCKETTFFACMNISIGFYFITYEMS